MITPRPSQRALACLLVVCAIVSFHPFVRATEVVQIAKTNQNLFALPTNFQYGRFAGDSKGAIYTGTPGKWDNAGVLLWTNHYPGEPRGIAVSGEGGLVVTGTDGQNCLTVRYAANGTGIWTNLYRGSGAHPVRGEVVTIDRGGTVLVGCNWEAAFIRYASNGLPVWTNNVGSDTGGSSYAGAVVLDTSGNAVCGVSVPTAQGFAAHFIKYNSVGVPQWTNTYNAGNENFAQSAVFADDGSVYCAANSRTPDAGSDFVLVKLSASGAPLWANHFDSPEHGNDYAEQVVPGEDGAIYVTGDVSTIGGVRSILLAYNTDGALLWSNGFNFVPGWDDWGARIETVTSNKIVVVEDFVSQSSPSRYSAIRLEYRLVPSFSRSSFLQSQFRTTVNGPSNSIFVIERTTNLVNWSSIVTNVVPASGSMEVLLNGIGNRSFYRLATP